METKKGFTIIELIVVIAIIAVLAAIVLVNVGQYSNKGKDASAKATLETLLKTVILFKSGTLDSHPNQSNYANSNSGLFPPGYCSDGWPDVFRAPCNALTANNMKYTLMIGYDTQYGSGSTKWCASIGLKQYSPVQYFCVDTSGAKKQGVGETCIDYPAADGGTCP